MAHTQGYKMISLSQSLAVISTYMSSKFTTLSLNPYNLAGVIIFNIIVYKYRDVRNRLFTIGNKFIISMIFALFTMFIVSGVEVARQYGCDGAGKIRNFFDLNKNVESSYF